MSTTGPPSTLGQRVRAARSRLVWSREKLAHEARLSWSGIEQIESGRRSSARPATLRALARALGVSIDYLVAGTPPPEMLSHRALFYDDDDAFLAAAVSFISEGVERSEAVLAATSPAKNEILRAALGDDGASVRFMDADSWYTEPAEALRTFRAFSDEHSKTSPWIRIVGELVFKDQSKEEVHVWQRLDSLVNTSLANRPVTVLCLYDVRSIDPTVVAAARRTHPEIVEHEDVSTNPSYVETGTFILAPQEDAH